MRVCVWKYSIKPSFPSQRDGQSVRHLFVERKLDRRFLTDIRASVPREDHPLREFRTPRNAIRAKNVPVLVHLTVTILPTKVGFSAQARIDSPASADASSSLRCAIPLEPFGTRWERTPAVPTSTCSRFKYRAETLYLSVFSLFVPLVLIRELLVSSSGSVLPVVFSRTYLLTGAKARSSPRRAKMLSHIPQNVTAAKWRGTCRRAPDGKVRTGRCVRRWWGAGMLFKWVEN